MTETQTISRDELDRVEARAQKLAKEKSYLQLIVNLINKLSAAPDLESAIETIIRVVLESIGGNNVSIYYFIDDAIFYADAYGEKKKLAQIADPLVRQALETGEFVEFEHEFSDTKMLTPDFTRASTWAYPLCVGSNVIGVLKTEDMLMSAHEVRRQLQAFFNYAALSLNNEILGRTRLQKAHDQLHKTNISLTNEIVERRRTEDALRESEKKYRTLFANMAGGFAHHKMIFDEQNNPVDYVFLEINDAFEQFTGLKRENLLNRKVTDAIPGIRDVEPDLMSVYGHVALTGEATKFELYFEPFDKWYLVSAFSSEKGYFAVLFDDITEHKQIDADIKRAKESLEEQVVKRTAALQLELAERRRVEDALRESETKFRAVFEKSVDALGVSKAGVHVFVNPAYLELFGYNASEELLGGSILDLVAPDQREKIQENTLRRAARENAPTIYETRGLRKDGSTFDMDVHVSLYELEDEVYSLAILRDITDQKQAKKALQHKTDELDQFFNVALELLCIADTDSYFRRLNPVFEKTLGYSRNELMTRPFLDFVHPDDLDRTREAVAQLANQQEVTNFVNRYRCKDGTYRCIEWSSAPSGKMIYAAARDITQQKQAEEKARIERRRLNSLLKISQQGAASVQELMDLALNEAIALSDSELGYIYYYSEQKREFTLHAWSKQVMDVCTIVNPDTIYQLERTGIWGEVVRQRRPIIVNDFPAPHPLKKGYPEGHAPLFRYMTLPIFDNNQIVAVVGTANKETDYDDQDVQQLSLMMDSIWKIVERRRAEEIIQIRARQQATVAQLGQLALIGGDFQVLMDEAAALVAQTLQVEYVKLLELLPDDLLLLRAGVGWQEGVVGQATVGIDLDSQAGYTLRSNEPVVVENLRMEKRFGGPLLLHDHGVVSSMSVIIPGRKRPYGVLSTHSTRFHQFTQDDIHFLQAVANLLATAIQRKEDEAALKKSEAQYIDLYDNAPDMYVSVDAKTARIEKCNRTLSENLGYPREAIIGRPIFDLYHPDCMEEVNKTFKQFTKTGEIRDSELQLMKIDGSKLEVSLNVSAVRDKEGNVLYSRSTWRDITARKQAEEELQLYREHLEELVDERTAELADINRELEAFSYSISHDLRTPLRAMDGFSQAILEDYADDLDDMGKDYLQRIRAASQRMGQLIDDILMLSRLSRAEMHVDSVDLSELAHLAAESLQSQQAHRRVAVTIQKGLTALGDSRLLLIALENLMGNAWKFTAKREEAQITFGVTQQNRSPVFFVRDNGAGFDKKYADKLFAPFQRLHSENEFPGTGVGLSIVKRIISRHGGRVWGESETGQGATFYFTLGG